jgi:hypothetical protein
VLFELAPLFESLHTDPRGAASSTAAAGCALSAARLAAVIAAAPAIAITVVISTAAAAIIAGAAAIGFVIAAACATGRRSVRSFNGRHYMWRQDEVQAFNAAAINIIGLWRCGVCRLGARAYCMRRRRRRERHRWCGVAEQGANSISGR